MPDPLPLSTVDRGALEAWVSATRDSSMDAHAVYVLDCTPPTSDRDFRIDSLLEHTREKVENGESLNEMERAAATLDRGGSVYYVGYTSDVVDRLERHATGASAGGAAFTNLFAPQAIVEVRWFETEAAARGQEPAVARELGSGADFAYWN